MNNLLHHSGITKTVKALPLMVSVGLVVILGVYWAESVWRFMTPYEIPQAQKAEAGKVPKSSLGKSKEDYGEVIAKNHLLGSSNNVQKAVAQPKVEKAPVTQLNLRLHGIIAYDDNNGFAMISSSGKDQKPYKKGDKVKNTGNVKVVSIHTDHVILDNNGKSEKLELPKANAVASSSSPSRTSSSQNKRSTSGKSNIASSSNLNDIRKSIVDNPMVLTEIFRFSPVLKGERFQGIRVQPGSRRDIFKKLGLKSGDIIVEVNGIPIDDMSRGMSVLQNLTTADTLMMQVKRGREIVPLNTVF